MCVEQTKSCYRCFFFQAAQFTDERPLVGISNENAELIIIDDENESNEIIIEKDVEIVEKEQVKMGENEVKTAKIDD